MKTFTLLALSLFFFNFANAQITKGSTFLGGSFGGGSNEQNDDQGQKSKNTNLGASAMFGKAVAENKLAGIFFSYSRYNSEYIYALSKVENPGNEIGGGIFYRQYFPVSKKWYLFGNGSLGYFSNETKREVDDKLTEKANGWSAQISFTPGVSFAAGRRLHIESSFGSLLNFGYGKATTKNYGSTGTVVRTIKSKSFGANANLSGFTNIYFGLRWILPSRKK